jgi:GNAT superfamily N-acetyltransferase
LAKKEGTDMSVHILGYGATWWRGDPLPTLPPLPGFRVVLPDDDLLLADLTHLAKTTIQQRRADGHQPYLAYLRQDPVAYGWVASEHAAIDELDLAFAVPAESRYLWDFLTLPDWRGRGFYPRLLQAIVRRERASVQRLWLAMTADNPAAHRAVVKAGFQVVEALVREPTGRLHILMVGETERALASPLGIRLGVIGAEP